ncbi:MAG: FtsQ-type POTRA domain-containing protein [Candidatus Wildermuthbacteria bacterium]|nr:FtsQ-type POTRA domain-containing protein [Candidatus Wildermuthbacteria bacterium]
MKRKSRSYKRPRRRKPLYLTKAFWIAVLFVSVFGAVFYALVISSLFQTQNIVVEGATIDLQKKILERAESEVSRRVALWDTRSLVFLNLKAMEEGIEKSFPEVEYAKIHRTLARNLQIEVQERTEIAVWCNEHTACFAMDNAGVIFMEKPEDGAFVIQDARGGQVALGEQALSDELLSFVNSFLEKVRESSLLKEAKVEFVSVALASEMRANWKSKEGWQAYSNPKGDLGWQFTKLQAVLEKKIPSSQRNRLEYIDLRFGDQAYIQYR